jgi:hypothetical protein
MDATTAAGMVASGTRPRSQQFLAWFVDLGADEMMFNPPMSPAKW